MEVPAKKIPYFKPSKELKDVVNNSAAPLPSAAPGPAPPEQRPEPLTYPLAESNGLSLDPLALSVLVTNRGCRRRLRLLRGRAAATDDRTWPHRPPRRSHNFVILNRFPYTSGHVMVVPYEHVATLDELPTRPCVGDDPARRAQPNGHLRAVYRPDGLNMGMNIGRSAGAGIAGHIHMHVLPRWIGDTNFMTVTGETRVVPEDLEVTWSKLSAAFSAPRA